MNQQQENDLFANLIYINLSSAKGRRKDELIEFYTLMGKGENNYYSMAIKRYKENHK